MFKENIELLLKIFERHFTLGRTILKNISENHIGEINIEDFEATYEQYLAMFINRAVYNLEAIKLLLPLYKLDENIETSIGLIVRAGLLDFFYILRLLLDKDNSLDAKETILGIETANAEEILKRNKKYFKEMEKGCVTETDKEEFLNKKNNFYQFYKPLYKSFNINTFDGKFLHCPIKLWEIFNTLDQKITDLQLLNILNRAKGLYSNYNIYNT